MGRRTYRYNDQDYSAKQLAEKAGLSVGQMLRRLKKMSIKEAVEKPSMANGSRSGVSLGQVKLDRADPLYMQKNQIISYLAQGQDLDSIKVKLKQSRLA